MSSSSVLFYSFFCPYSFGWRLLPYLLLYLSATIFLNLDFITELFLLLIVQNLLWCSSFVTPMELWDHPLIQVLYQQNFGIIYNFKSQPLECVKHLMIKFLFKGEVYYAKNSFENDKYTMASYYPSVRTTHFKCRSSHFCIDLICSPLVCHKYSILFHLDNNDFLMYLSSGLITFKFKLFNERFPYPFISLTELCHFHRLNGF